MPADAIEQPITVQRIQAETNAEVQRVMIELYGFDRYASDANIQARNRDARGTLYRIENPMLPIQFVRVKNSTPEPDGTTKYYNLRVPNEIETAADAVAFTFGMKGGDYMPAVET